MQNNVGKQKLGQKPTWKKYLPCSMYFQQYNLIEYQTSHNMHINDKTDVNIFEEL